MNLFKLIILGTGLFIFSCNQNKTKSTSIAEVEISDENKAQLQHLVRELYEWFETQNPTGDFYPVSDEDSHHYIGLDLQKHNNKLNELRQTNFFANEFLNDYNQITLTIHEKLNNKELEWLVGDLPPFGNGASLWCNCQDTPNNYWQIITIDEISFENNISTFTWSWGDDFNYEAKAVWENDGWKILYLEGFDVNEFI